MPVSSGKNEWGSDFNQDYTILHAWLIDIFLLIFTLISTVLVIYLLFVFPPFQSGLEREIINIYISSAIMLTGGGVVYCLKRWISVDVAAIFLLLFLVIAIIYSDIPVHVAEDRTLIIFSIPIIIASVIYRPWASFVVAGINILTISFLDIQYLHKVPNILAFIVFFILALAAWLFTRARDDAMASLYRSLERERKLAEVLDHASQPFATAYPNGRLAAFNIAFCDLLGYSPEEIQDISLLEDITPLEWHQFEKNQLKSIDITGQSVRYEKELLKKDGTRIYVELLVHLIRDAQGNPDFYYAFITDLTERRKTEQEFRRLNLELEQRVADRTKQLHNTLSELESFAYSVSHDLRAPLRTIDGFSQALESEYSSQLKGDGLHYLERTRAGVKRMDQLITDLLKLSRVTQQEINYERVDLTEIAYGIRDELQNLQPNRSIEWEITEGMNTFGDANLLKVAVENLLQNAWKFTSTKNHALIQFGFFQQNGEKVYFVRDNGVGFDMKYADKLFGAFQRLHSPNDFPGTGIGLATVQRIVHRHGGIIWAEASVDHGAAFNFTLDEKMVN